tara:strand:+ start:312 stop:1415 length:1104 start_codon:yes stop_codon:yes gene_type:complete
MKIAISTNNCWNAYNFRKELILELLKKNNEVYILSKKDNYTDKIIQLGCKFYEIKIENHNFSIIDNIKSILSYFYAFKKIRPDIYLGFTIKPNIYGSLVGYFFKFKKVNTVTGLGTSFLYSNMFIKFFVIFLYKISFYKSHKIVFHNKDDENLFLKNKIINIEQSSVVPGSGINFNDYPKLTFKKSKNKTFIFLFVGRIIKDKGIYELVEASKKFKKKYSNYKIKIVGEIDMNNRSSLSLKKIKDWDKEKLIEYIGYKKNIKNLILESDCAVLPSYREGSSRFLLEAAALEKPIICSNVPGCNNIVKDGFNGYLFNHKDINSIFNAMMKIYELSFESKKQFGINGREYVKKNFDVNIVINEYLNIIY